MILFVPPSLYFTTKHSFETPFFSQFVLCKASDNTTSQNIGVTDAWVVPNLKFLGDRPPYPKSSVPYYIIYKETENETRMQKVNTQPYRQTVSHYERQ